MFYFTGKGLSKIHDWIIESLGGEQGPLNKGNVEAAAQRPRTKIYHEEPFNDIVAKAAALGYSLNRWHGFLDGNKRTSLMSIILMLEMNDVHFTMPPYMTKYLLLVAQDKMEESEFDFLIRKHSSNSRLALAWKDWRYSWLPSTWFSFLSLIPITQSYSERIEKDWLAAGSPETLERVFQEFEVWERLGYPKFDVELKISNNLETAVSEGDIDYEES